MAEEKWSSHVGHLEEGGLHGWCASCPPEERHRAIERTVQADGYATAIRRLNFLSNVANRRDNGHLHRVAREDEEWARRWEERIPRRRGPTARSWGPTIVSEASSVRSRGGGNACDPTLRGTLEGDNRLGHIRTVPWLLRSGARHPSIQAVPRSVARVWRFVRPAIHNIKSEGGDLTARHRDCCVLLG